jgi:lipopolysaccharide/colanic/teichoic acid biosynthesis glycosyltransferase
MDVPTTAPELRPGFYNEVIGVLKFRTMHIDRADPSGAQRTVRNDPRVTRLGRILRWLSFDGLPQLINVIRGDMSLVGPRPHAVAMKAGTVSTARRSSAICIVIASSQASSAGPRSVGCAARSIR